MKVPLANLLCITVLASSGSSFPMERRGAAAGKEKRVQYAAWDDVNVLAHGLLQLGQGLKEHVDKTKGQVRDITIKMKVFNVTVSELGKLTQRLQEDSMALKAKAQSLEESERLVLNVSTDLREKTKELLKDRQKDHLMQGEGLEVPNGNYSDARVIQVCAKTLFSRLKESEAFCLCFSHRLTTSLPDMHCSVCFDVYLHTFYFN